MQPLVSVIIPVYNRLTHLHAAIESVLAQTHRPIEIIVVDDGSTEDVRKHLEPYADRIIYLEKEHGGVASTRNAGVGRATGEFIAFLDDDDVFLPEKLEKQVAVLRDHPEIALVYSDEYLLDEAGRMTETSQQKDRIPPLPSGFIARDFFMDSFIALMTVTVRRSVFDEVGGFDESMLYNEDDDLWFRIMLQHPARCSGYVSGARRLHGLNMSKDRTMMSYYQLHCIDKYIKQYPGFVKDNGEAVLQRIRYVFSLYISMSLLSFHLPRVMILTKKIEVEKHLRELLKSRHSGEANRVDKPRGSHAAKDRS